MLKLRGLTNSNMEDSYLKVLRVLFFYPVYPSDYDQKGAILLESKGRFYKVKKTYRIVLARPGIEVND